MDQSERRISSDFPFLKGYYSYVTEHLMLRKANGENSKGNDTRCYMCPLGVNEVMLTQVKLFSSKGFYYIQLHFQPSPQIILGKKERMAPLKETIFESQVKDIGLPWGHTFKPRPDNMDLKTYLGHVCNRMNTFKSIWVKVPVIYEKGVIRDKYGEIDEMTFGARRYINPVYYPRILFEEEFDWSTAIREIRKDKEDYEKWWVTNRDKQVLFTYYE